MATIVTKSIGSAAGRDYTSLQAFWAAIPSDLVAVDQAWIGEFYKDSEFIVTGAQTLATKTTDATRNITLRPATGQGFIDNPNILTTPYKYNAANGVAIRGSVSGNRLFLITQNNLLISGLQFQNTAAAASTSVLRLDGTIVLENSIIESAGSGQFSEAVLTRGGTVRNTLVVMTGADSKGVTFSTLASLVENVTSLRSSAAASGGWGFFNGSSTSSVVRNCASFNTIFSSGAFTGSNNAGSDNIGFGTNNLSGLVYANQFENTATDFRTKAGSALMNSGAAPSAGNTKTVTGNRVQGSAADIGSWESYVVATSITLSGMDGSVGNANPITVAVNGEITQSVVVTLAVTGGGTFNPPTVTLTPTTTSVITNYTAASVGSKTITTTNDKGFTNAAPLTLNFIVAPILYPTPSTQGKRVVKVGSGTGQDFADIHAFASYLSGQDLVAQQEMLIAEVYSDQVVSTRSIQYGIAKSSNDYYCVIRPVKGLDVVSREGVSTFDYGSLGIEIKVSTELKIGHGVVMEGFRFDCGTAGNLRIGGPNPNGATRMATKTGYRRNRIKVGGGFALGEYSTTGLVVDNLIIREQGAGAIRCSGGGNEISRNTFVVRNSAVGSFLTGDYDTLVENNAFIGVGDTPISTTSSRVDNNYTDTQVAVTRKGIIYVQGPLVLDSTSNFIPTASSSLVGNGSTSANSIIDNRSANRGIDPDVGAWQRVAAPDLPTIVLNGTPSPDGQQLTVLFTVGNSPTGSSAVMNPAGTNAGSASSNTGVVTINQTSGQAVFTDLSPGSYNISISVSNQGGVTSLTGLPQIEILEISGSPEASGVDSNPTVTVPSKPVMVMATSQVGGVSVTGTVMSNGGSNIVEYRVLASTGQAADNPTLPVFVPLPEGVTATFTLVAVNDVGPSQASAPSNSATSLGEIVMTAPDAPTVLASGGLNNISVYVTPPTFTGNSPITSYTVVMSTGETKTQQNTTFVFDYQDENARTAVAYATNNIGDSPLSQASSPVSPTLPYLPVINVTLKTSDNQFVAVDTSLSAVWFDQVSPLEFEAPAWKGSVVVLDGGLVSIILDTSDLSSGDTGWLILTDSDGSADAFYKAFSGPVTVI